VTTKEYESHQRFTEIFQNSRLARLLDLDGVFDATETGLRAATNKTPIEWSRALALGLSLWYEWAILAWVLARLARWFPLEQRFGLHRVLVHLLLGAILRLPSCAWITRD